MAESNDTDDMDINSTETILRINYKQHSIVINTQTPNRQLWYSCTKSGPQRFDYHVKGDQNGSGEWLNKNGEEIL